MKKFALFLFVSVATAFSAKAQDIVTTKDSTVVQARVLSVGQADVRFKKYDNLEGPTYILSKSELLSVKFENGKELNFAPNEGALASGAQGGADSLGLAKSKSPKPVFNMSFYGGYGHRLGKMVDDGSVSEVEIIHAKRLANGHSLGGDISFFVNQNLGFGVVANDFMSSSTDYGTITYDSGKKEDGYYIDKLNIFSVGPAVFVRYITPDRKAQFSMSYALCYVRFNQNKSMVSESATVTANAFGDEAAISFDYFVAPKFSIGIFARMIRGSFSKYTVTDNKSGAQQDYTLESNSLESIGTIKAGVSLGLHF